MKTLKEMLTWVFGSYVDGYFDPETKQKKY